MFQVRESFQYLERDSQGVSVHLDLRNVAQPPDAEAVKLPVERVRYAATDAGFPRSGGAGQADNLALRRPPQLAHRNELEDPLL